MNWNAENTLSLLQSRSKTTSNFSLAFVRQLLEIGRIKELTSKEILIKAGGRVQNIFIPLSAPLKGYEPSGNQQIIIYDPGTLIGLAQGLSMAPFPYDLRAVAPTDALVLPFSHLRSLIEHDASIRWQVIEYISIKLSETEREDVQHLSADPAVRLAKLFLDLASRYGETQGNNIRLNVKISQEELGARIGISRQSTNKYVHEFIEKQLLAKDGHRYIILDCEGLSDLSQQL